jgi:hypothetical protein
MVIERQLSADTGSGAGDEYLHVPGLIQTCLLRRTDGNALSAAKPRPFGKPAQRSATVLFIRLTIFIF